VLFYTLGNFFKQQFVQFIDHGVDVLSSRLVAKAIFGTSACAIAYKLPQLIPLVQKTTVYLSKLFAITCTMVGYIDLNHTLVVF
jgi:hypothetical protein